MIHVRMMRLATVAIALVALAGCQKQAGEAKKETKNGPVLAEVSGTNITVDEFKKEVENLPPYLKPMAESADGKKEMLETMIIRELILQDAKKDGIENSPAVTEKLEDLKKRLVVEVYLKKKVDEQSKVTDEELQKFYDQNKEKFKSGDEVKASHILLKDEKTAQDVLAKVKSGGNFEELAKKYSIDSAAAKGGDLGWFGKEAMIPEFAKAAFALKEGETSGIVKTKFGFHIIKVTGKRAAGTRSFADVKDQIKAAILPSKQQEVFQKLKDELKKSGKYTIKEDVLKSLGGAATGEAKGAAAMPPAEPKAQEVKK
jgi:peptidyl-prolyl cis-trans isomerase C